MKRIPQLVSSKNWNELEDLLNDHNTTSSLRAVEIIYQLYNILSGNWDMPNDDFNKVRDLLIRFFAKSYRTFSENPDYLFFVGSLICLCDWCFGLDDTSRGVEMLRRAADLNPLNVLFQWGYAFSTSQPGAETISRKIAGDPAVFHYLSSMGEVGKFIAAEIRNLPFYLDLP